MSSLFPSQAGGLLSLSWSPNQDNNRSCIKNFDSDNFLVVQYQLCTFNTRFCYYIEQQNQCSQNCRSDQYRQCHVTIQKWLHHFLSDFVWNVSETRRVQKPQQKQSGAKHFSSTWMIQVAHSQLTGKSWKNLLGKTPLKQQNRSFKACGHILTDYNRGERRNAKFL